MILNSSANLKAARFVWALCLHGRICKHTPYSPRTFDTRVDRNLHTFSRIDSLLHLCERLALVSTGLRKKAATRHETVTFKAQRASSISLLRKVLHGKSLAREHIVRALRHYRIFYYSASSCRLASLQSFAPMPFNSSSPFWIQSRLCALLILLCQCRRSFLCASSAAVRLCGQLSSSTVSTVSRHYGYPHGRAEETV